MSRLSEDGSSETFERIAVHGAHDRRFAPIVGLCIACVGIAAAVAVISAGPTALPGRAWSLVLWVGAGALWIAAISRAARIPLAIAVAGTVLLRIAAGCGDPHLSDDVHRYVWEGALVAEGTSPYGLAPNAPERSSERARWSEVYEGINHPEIAATYPPFAQVANAVITITAGGASAHAEARRGMRIAYAFADLLCMVPLVVLLRRRGVPDGYAIVWGWSPLVALEFAGSAHFDSLGVLLLLVGVVLADGAYRAGRPWSPGAVLAATAGSLVKIVPIVVVPFASRRHPVRGLLLACACFSLAWLPFALTTGPGLFAGLGQYALRWESASLVFRFVEGLLDPFLERDEGLLDPRRVARAVVVLLWSVVFVHEWRRPPDVVRSTAILVGTLLVLSPTLHPWYLTWVVPFIALRPSRAWLVLLAMAPLLYWPLEDWQVHGVWTEPAWLWPVVALPFFLVRGFELSRTSRAEGETAS